MPQPAELDELQSPLLKAYQRAWERVQEQQQQLALDPLKYRRRLRLVEMRRAIEAQMDELDAQTSSWISNKLPRAYLAGVQQGAVAAGTSPVWTMIHQEAVEELATSLFQELLDATKHVKDTTKDLIRGVAKDEILQAAIEGRTAKLAGREMQRVLAKSGISAVTYANGAQHGLAEYSEMAVRTTTAKAYNSGSINAEPDVTYFEVFDGPSCGWTRHSDPDLALGRIVTRDEAQAQLISHPNCRRAFGPRPDLTTPKQAKAADGGQVRADQVQAQLEQDALRGDPDAIAELQGRTSPQVPDRVARQRARREQGRPVPKLPAAKAETPKQAARRAKLEMQKIKSGNLRVVDHPPNYDAHVLPDPSPMAGVPTVLELIDKGYSGEAAVTEYKRLLKLARNAERRARLKAAGFTEASKPKATVKPGELSFADKSGIGAKAGNAKRAALKAGATPAEAEDIFQATKAKLTAERLAELADEKPKKIEPPKPKLPLTADQRAAWERYTLGLYNPINARLRGRKNPIPQSMSQWSIEEIDDQIKLLKESMYDSTKPLVLQRRFENQFYQFPEGLQDRNAFNVGDLVTDPAFLSTTTRKGGLKDDAFGSWTMEIRAPAGTRMRELGTEFTSEAEVVLGAATELRVISRKGKHVVVEVVPKNTVPEVPKVVVPKSAIELLQDQDIATTGLLDEPLVIHEGFGGAGGRLNGPWYNRMKVDTVGYVPVYKLDIQNHVIQNGLATRRNGISYLQEFPEGPISDVMRADFEANIAKIAATLADVPKEAVVYQRGFAMLSGNNPADAYWANQYKIPNFKSAATGGNGGTTFWNSPVNPGTVVHELGHNLDSGYLGANGKAGVDAWITDGAQLGGPTLDPYSWKDAGLYDQEFNTSSVFDAFVETRPGGHKITPGKTGVTSYGSVSIREDWAESFRLYVKDRREKKLGYLPAENGQALGTNLRFADLFPERAAFFDRVLGTQTDFDTAFRKRQTDKFLEDWSPDSLPSATNITSYLDTILALPPNTIAKQYGIPMSYVPELQKRAAAQGAEFFAAKALAEAAAKAAKEAAEAAAKAAKPLTIEDLSFADKSGIGAKAGNAKKAALKGGASPAEAKEVFLRVKAHLQAERLAVLNADRGLISGKLDFDLSGAMSPDFVNDERDAAQAWALQAGDSVHPLAEKQSNQAAQAKANLVAELASRLNNREDWDKYATQRGFVQPFDAKTATARQKELDTVVSELVQNWAQTSGDSNTIAVALQQAVQDEFGVTGNAYAGVRSQKTKVKTDVTNLYTKAAPFYRRFVRTMYENTQDELKAAGITRISVYRGMNLPATVTWGRIGTQSRPLLMPANSWSSNRSTSQNFGSTMFEASIPANRVLGTARTGFGCRNEFEFVCFDTDGLASVKQSR